jgi:hypothetical protein
VRDLAEDLVRDCAVEVQIAFVDWMDLFMLLSVTVSVCSDRRKYIPLSRSGATQPNARHTACTDAGHTAASPPTARISTETAFWASWLARVYRRLISKRRCYWIVSWEPWLMASNWDQERDRQGIKDKWDSNRSQQPRRRSGQKEWLWAVVWRKSESEEGVGLTVYTRARQQHVEARRQRQH